MNYIIYDLEWDENGWREIVEIGAVKAIKVDGKLEIVDRFQSFVKPTKHPYTDFCEKFTNIPREVIELSKTFPEVMNDFKNWVGSENNCYCTWGSGDESIFRRNCTMHKINFKEIVHVTNDVQLQVSKILKSGQRTSLKKAIEILKIQHDNGTYHRADFDAEGTAKVISQLIDKINIVENLSSNINVESKKKRIDSFVLNNRKQMSAWMESRLEVALEKIPEEMRSLIMLDVARWESELKELKKEVTMIYNSSDKLGRKEYYDWVDKNHQQHVRILLKMYHSQEISESLWKRHLFMLTFHSKKENCVS